MKISKHFSESEFTKSSTATKYGIDNSIPNDAKNNIQALCDNVLERIREEFGRISISSGYRCLELNRKLGSSDNSQHVKGEAADIQFYDYGDIEEAFNIIRMKYEFDQIIYEVKASGTAWIHISWNNNYNRNEALTAKQVNGKMVYYSV